MKYLAILFTCFALLSSTTKDKKMKPYVIEITTFKFKESVNADDFWKEDATITATYTSKQPGYISRESGYNSEKNEVVVVVKWKTMTDAETSMNKFMTDTSVTKYANMIDGSSMKMTRYNVD